jgi:hypothetical protein
MLVRGANVLGNQVISLLRVYDRHRKGRTTSTMVQPESNHDTQLYRVRLLDRPDSYKLHIGKGVQWARMYFKWTHYRFGLLTCVCHVSPLRSGWY